MTLKPWSAAVLASALALVGGAAIAQSNTIQEIEKYRQGLQDGNPAELHEMKGEELWKEKRGPKKVSLEQCDLGLGPGVVKGVYAKLPRYFKDTNKVEDLESRLVTCMTTLQGFTKAEVTKHVFSSPNRPADMEALVAYITALSRGAAMDVKLTHPKEKQAYQTGEKIFFHRAGPHDFACATCHGSDNIRIRLQDLPNLTDKAAAQKAYTSWPAYRVSQGETRSFQWRLNDCFRQQRFPNLEYVSEASIALTTYLAVNANGGRLTAPAIKR